MNIKKIMPLLMITFFTLCIPLAIAQTIPTEYSSELDLSTPYTYDVKEFEDQPIYWYTTNDGINWYSRGTVESEAGGQIIVEFVKFDSKSALDYSSSAFPSETPYIDITFNDKSGATTTSFIGISNAEAAMNLALSYNCFYGGFLIPTSDISGLKEDAKDQDTEYMATTVSITQVFSELTIKFAQDSGAQITTVTYDVSTGLLLSADVDNEYGPDLRITLSGHSSIPGFPVEILLMGISIGAVMIVMLKIKRT